jgi:ADP-heptose:LPS heptosyltransferase
MHIAAAFKKKILSFWGNTVPEFGMFPYQAHSDSKIVEVKNLKCRPCSKLGYDKCPKKHFNCMNQIDLQMVMKWIKENY